MLLIRPKLFLTCAVLCITPLLAVSLLSLGNSLKATKTLALNALNVELSKALRDFEGIERDREHELEEFARSRAMHRYLVAARRFVKTHDVDQSQSRSALPATGAAHVSPQEQSIDARSELGNVLGKSRKYYVSIVVFDPSGQPLFVDEKLQTSPEGVIIFQKAQWSFDQFHPDERVWTLRPNEAICAIVKHSSRGQVLRCSVPVFPGDKGAPVYALVADVILDELISEATRHWDLSTAAMPSQTTPPERMALVLSSSEHIIYHTNSALRHQLINSSMPPFAPVASAMLGGQSGWQSFRSAEGDEWLAAYAPVKSANVFFAIGLNYSQVAKRPWRDGCILIALSLVIGLAAATLLAHYLERQRVRIVRVSESVAAIAKGDLTQRIEARSSDDIRPLSDNLNLMTAQLREQIARETEARQFQAFVRLSAMLTHDLKNAIEALSLLVSNMERHYDNQEFRADAMKSLNISTQNLKALVARLSNPVTTLSGEHMRPQPVDLVPILQKVIKTMADPLRHTHHIETDLPPSLIALVDGERIEKCIENLVLNGLEAMGTKSGTLKIEAGNAEQGKVFFKVTDTGVGMSPDFIERQLYHPFATTKRKGVGLGLYTCREVVRANGGAIEVDSREGAGTTFRVVLPSAAIERTN